MIWSVAVGWLTRQLQPLLAVASLAFLIAAGVQTARLHRAEATLASERLAAANAALRAVDAAHQRERAMQAARDAAITYLELKDAELQQLADHNAALVAEIERLRRAVRVAVSDADGLRERLSAYAAGTAGDPRLTCADRAAGLAAYAADVGRAAAEVAESAGELAEAAQLAARERDTTAARLVACVTAWPR